MESAQFVPRVKEFKGGDKSSAPKPPPPTTIPPRPTLPVEVRLTGFTIVPMVTETLDSGEGNAALDALIKASSLEESGIMNVVGLVISKGRYGAIEAVVVIALTLMRLVSSSSDGLF
jgi:hypothetical protein